MSNIEVILDQVKALKCHMNHFTTLQLGRGPVKIDSDEDCSTVVIGLVLFSKVPGKNYLFWNMIPGWGAQPLLLPIPKAMEYQQYVSKRTLPVAFIYSLIEVCINFFILDFIFLHFFNRLLPPF